MPGPTFAEQLRGLLLAQQHLHSLGITAWQDAIVGEYLGFPDPLPAYLAAAPGRHARRPGRGCRGGIAAAAEISWTTCSTGGSEGQAGRFRAGTVKIMQDGVAENFTAGMIDPYLDGCGCQSGNGGLSMWSIPPTWPSRSAARHRGLRGACARHRGPGGP